MPNILSDSPYHYLAGWKKKKSQITLLAFHYHLDRCTDTLISIAKHCVLLKMNSEIHFLSMGLLEKEVPHIKTSTLHPTYTDYSAGLTFKEELM